MSAGHLAKHHSTILLMREILARAVEAEKARLLGRLEDPAPWFADAKAALELMSEKETE